MESAANLFDKLRKRAEVQSMRTGFYSNENVLKLKQNEKYKLRLLWIPAANGYDRDDPTIEQYIHRYWDNNAVGQKGIELYCKTSKYDEGETKAGFDCPVCKRMNKIYKEYTETNSKSLKEIYDTFKRVFRGYIPVYVISGPKEDVGKIKIFQFTKSFKDFFNQYIFGVSKTNNSKNDEKPVDEDEIIGIKAFTYYDEPKNKVELTAYDLSITVLPNKIRLGEKDVVVPKYTMNFTRNMSKIDLGWEDEELIEHYKKLSETLSFDKDFLKKTSTEDLEAFVKKYIDNSTASSNSIEETVEEETEVNEEENSPLNKMKKIAKASKEAAEYTKANEIEEPETEQSTNKSDDDDSPPFDADENSSNEEETSNKNNEDEEDVDIEDLLKNL